MLAPEKPTQCKTLFSQSQRTKILICALANKWEIYNRIRLGRIYAEVQKNVKWSVVWRQTCKDKVKNNYLPKTIWGEWEVFLGNNFIICIQCKPRSCLLFVKLFVACAMYRIVLISTQNNRKCWICTLWSHDNYAGYCNFFGFCFYKQYYWQLVIDKGKHFQREATSRLLQVCVWEAEKGTNQAQWMPIPSTASVPAENGHVPLNRVCPCLFFTLEFLLVQQPNKLPLLEMCSSLLESG